MGVTDKTVYKNKRLMLIEDCETCIYLIEEFLIDTKIEIVTCNNSIQAKTILMADTYFDIILLDIKLPGESGLVLYQWLQNEISHIPVVICTAYNEAFISQKIKEQGEVVPAILMKPLRKDILINQIEQTIKGHN